MRVQAFNLFDALLVVDTHPGGIKKGPFKSFRGAGVGEERRASTPPPGIGQMGICSMMPGQARLAPRPLNCLN